MRFQRRGCKPRLPDWVAALLILALQDNFGMLSQFLQKKLYHKSVILSKLFWICGMPPVSEAGCSGLTGLTG